jgi:glutamate dehydrogenase (NAD(P)+)
MVHRSTKQLVGAGRVARFAESLPVSGKAVWNRHGGFGSTRPPAFFGQTRAVPLQKLSSTDAFVVVDLDDTPTADGVVRWARKVLVDGARTMARSRTYSWALLGERVSGASAGISAAPDARGDAIAAFCAEVADRVSSGALSLDAGKGLDPADLAPLAGLDQRPGPVSATTPSGSLADALLAAGVASAAAVALGGLDGRTVAIEGAGTAGPALIEAFAGRGAATVAVGTSSGTVAVAPDADSEALGQAWADHGEGLPAVQGSELPAAAVLAQTADVLVCGSKLGLVDHDVAATLPHRVVVPCSTAPVTARGLAVATRRDVIVLPDFLTVLGPLLAFRPAGGADPGSLLAAAADRVASLTNAALAHEEGPYLGACHRAEEFLRSWQDAVPFGRPLA